MGHQPSNNKGTIQPNKTGEHLFDMINQTIKQHVCPNFGIFHTGISAKGNAWGKFYCACRTCKLRCEYFLDRGD